MGRAGSDRAARAHSHLHERSPLVGRSAELATLHERLADLGHARGSVALIAGEAGIGKTALAHALCSEADARQVLVLVGRASDLHEVPPYDIWLDLFAHYHR